MSATESLDLMRDALAKAIDDGTLAKATFNQPSTTTTGLQTYNLEAPAKNLVPWLTPLRNQIPRVGGGFAIGANWKAVTGYNTTQLSAGIVEGRRGALIDYSMKEYYAAFRTIGLESSASFEAVHAGVNFDDIRARAVTGLLRSLMLEEEKIILGGNATNSLGTTPTPTLTTSTSGGSIGATITVSVICVGLSYDAWRRQGTATTTLAQTYSRTNTDATSDTINAGTAIKSAAATIATGAGSTNSVTAKVAPMRGAYAYAWYAGTAGNERFVSVTTVSQAVITSLPGASQLASALASTDYSADATIHDGLLGMIGNSTYGSYYSAVTAGSSLTADGAGGIVEFDTALRWFYDNLRMLPDQIWLATQEVATVKKIIMQQGASTALSRFNFTMTQQGLVGGAVPTGYISPYGDNRQLTISQHPYLAPGTVLFVSHSVPYDLSGIDNVIRILARRDYYQLEWPLRTRAYEYGVYTDQVLQHYYPPSMGIITNLS